MCVCLQDGTPVVLNEKTGTWEVNIGKLRFLAESKARVLELVSNYYRVIDTECKEHMYHYYVFHPTVFKP